MTTPFPDPGAVPPITPFPFPSNTGAVPIVKSDNDFLLGQFQLPVALPPTFVQEVRNLIPAYNQKQIPACGSHAGAFIDSVLQTNKLGIPQILSPEYLWKEIKLIDGFPPSDGTDIRSIMRSLASTGDCSITLMPNNTDQTLVQYTDPTPLTDALLAAGFQNKISSYAFEFGNHSMEQLKQTIYQNKVAIARINIGTGWWTGTNGQLTWDESQILPIKLGDFVGTHFVVLYGYLDITPDELVQLQSHVIALKTLTDRYSGQKAVRTPERSKTIILFRNSFSPDWGNLGDGYFDETYLPNLLELATAITLNVPFVFKKNLYIGMTDPDVMRLQEALNQRGFMVATTSSGSPGQETTFFGQLTFQAVKKYQAAHTIPTTGFCGPLTRASLNADL